MDSNRFRNIDLGDTDTPSYIVDEYLLEENLRKLEDVQSRAGCRILLSLKAFSMYPVFGLIRKYLRGVNASSLNEARLGREEFGREVHTFSPAYSPREVGDIIKYSDYMIFNSFYQWEAFGQMALEKGKKCGLRVNPEYSEVAVDLYNPCAENSRLGIREKEFYGREHSGITGLHFHAMCEQNADTLVRVLKNFEKLFGEYLSGMEWVNFGGGHHITREDYDAGLLIDTILKFREKYGLTVYLEPGEAVALNAGVLVSTVLDIVAGDPETAILDTSAEAHMPDVLAMPYRPEVMGGGKPGQHECTYRLAGNTCLAGDIIGDYSFERPLRRGDKLFFMDMAHYTMVKNTVFNGVKIPSIMVMGKDGSLRKTKEFGYEDYKRRL